MRMSLAPGSLSHFNGVDWEKGRQAIRCTHEAIDDDAANSYLPFMGQHALREAAVERVQRFSGVTYDPDTEF